MEKFKKKKRTIVLSLLIIFILLIIFLPMIFSNTIGKKIIISSLEKKTGGTVHVKTASFSWLGPQVIEGLQLSSPLIELSIEKFSADVPLLSASRLRSLGKKTIFSLGSDLTVKDMDVSIHAPGLSPIVFANINIDLKTTKQIPTLTINGKTFERSHEGRFSAHIQKKNDKNINGEFLCRNIPVAGLDKLYSLFGKQKPGILTSFFGKTLSLRSTFSIDDEQGPFNFFLDSSLAQASLDGRLTSKGLVLNKPFLASFYLTEDFIRFAAKQSKTPLTTITRSKTPIKIRVDNRDFFLPLHPFILQNFRFHLATLDLGILEIKNIRAIDDISKALKQSISSQRRTTLWFTAVNLNLYNSLMKTDRLDVLINNSLHVCLWGDINLSSLYIDMTLGIPANTLQNVLGIKKLPNNYVLQMPMKGTLPRVKVDTSLAATKIAALMAAGQAKGLVGGILGAIGSLQEKPAPPAKKPFPWEGTIPKSSSPNQSNDAMQNFFDLFNK